MPTIIQQINLFSTFFQPFSTLTDSNEQTNFAVHNLNKEKMKRLRITGLMIFAFTLFFTKTYCQTGKYQKLVYQWSAPIGLNEFPVVLIIGGSEGGMNYGQKWIPLLNKKGFGVMALAYLGKDSLNEQFEEIPIEYFQTALDTLRSFKGVDVKKVSIISMSKGTEAAMLLAIDNPDIKLLVVASPSHLVWQGINRENYQSLKSSWTKNKMSLPFISYDYSKGYYPLINFYLGALEKPINQYAIIPVERIKCKIVVLSGGKDMVWPSTIMANNIKSRFLESHTVNEIVYKDFPNSGHGFLIPFQTDIEKQQILEKIRKNIDFLGGSVDAFENAMTESLKIVINELSK